MSISTTQFRSRSTIYRFTQRYLFETIDLVLRATEVHRIALILFDSASPESTPAEIATAVDARERSASRIVVEEQPSTARRWYYLGTAVPIWDSWVAGTVLWAPLNVRVPERWGREFVVPLVFLALLSASVDDRTTLAIPGIVYVGDAFRGPHRPVAWRTESILATVAAGMATLWLVRLVV